jgi:hypothetical protein
MCPLFQYSEKSPFFSLCQLEVLHNPNSKSLHFREILAHTCDHSPKSTEALTQMLGQWHFLLSVSLRWKTGRQSCSVLPSTSSYQLGHREIGNQGTQSTKVPLNHCFKTIFRWHRTITVTKLHGDFPRIISSHFSINVDACEWSKCVASRKWMKRANGSVGLWGSRKQILMSLQNCHCRCWIKMSFCIKLFNDMLILYQPQTQNA